MARSQWYAYGCIYIYSLLYTRTGIHAHRTHATLFRVPCLRIIYVGRRVGGAWGTRRIEKWVGLVAFDL